MHPYTVTCPSCGLKLKLPPTIRPGRTVGCSKCRCLFPATPDGGISSAEDSFGEAEIVEDEASGVDIDPTIPDMPVERKKPKKERGPWGLIIAIALPVLILIIVSISTTLIVMNWETLGFSANKIPAGWKEMTSVDNRIRFVIPEPFLYRKRTMASPVGDVEDYQYLHEVPSDKISYSITYADFSEVQLQQMSLPAIMTSGATAVGRALRGRTESDHAIELNGRKGWQYIIDTGNQSKHIMRYYMDRNRLYTVMAMGKNASLEHKEVSAFFTHFKFVDSR